MKKTFLTLLKIFGGLVAFCVALVVGAVFLLNTDSFQNKLLQKATEMLSDKLQTRVQIDHVSVGLFSQDLRLYGLDVEDQQQRKMLQLDTLSVDVDVLPLLRHEIRISEVKVKGVRALLLKPSPDSVANYQFVIDAFKKDKSGTEGVEREAKAEECEEKEKLSLAIDRGRLEHIHVTYNNQQYDLGVLEYKLSGDGQHVAAIRQLQRQWVAHTKHGDVDNRLIVGLLNVVYAPDRRHVSLEEANFTTDGHRPRKNAGKPKRGFFDADHLDIMASLQADITHADKDSVAFNVTRLHAIDKGSGLNLDDLQMKGAVSHGVAYLNDVNIKLPNTQLRFDYGQIQLPSKKQGRTLSYQASPIKARVLLKDIAKPFAPVLGNFNLPLDLSVRFSGTDQDMHFRDVIVGTTDKQLTVKASGSITGLKDKQQLAVRFHVDRMVAKGGSKERVISQFHVKKFMMKQLHNLGTIYYTGDFAVLWKKEVFQGLLSANGGRINFQFALDEQNKYVTGMARTDSFLLGKEMDMPDIGKIACKANFKFDISKPRTARMRRQKGGKLPIGQVDAEVYEAQYKSPVSAKRQVKVRNVVASIKSDGAIAEGDLTVKGKRVDVLCSFSFTNTNEMKKTKIKPGVRFHKLSDTDRAAKEVRKQQKADEKAQQKQRKAEE